MAFGTGAATAAEGTPALNAEQRRAVEHGDGPLLVVAGAGTGKTRVIIERIRNLLETDPTLAGENILGLTFTDKAAGEMKSRVVRAIGERAEGVWLSTFHKFCQEKILQAVNPDLQVLEPIDQWILLRRNIAELQLVKFWKLTDPGEFLNAFVAFFSRCHDELVTPDDFQRYVEGLRRGFESRKMWIEADALAIEQEEVELQEELARAFRVSERLVREHNFVTFGEQLMNAVHLLRTDAGLLERMREQYRYILVDEFQDTNIAQLELLWLLAGERGNIVAVGDDDQAIYRFRGASFGSFTIFLKRFCGVKDSRLGAEAKRFLVSLSQNYRSTRRILRVAGQAISHNEKSQLLPPKKLTTEQPDGERIRIAEFATPEEEAQWIAMEIERLHAAGSEWRKFAVLYRKHTHRERLLVALRSRRIPFVIKNLSILTSTIVRDLVAYVRAIATPSDNVAAARVLAVPYWGLEPRDLLRLAERAEKNRRRPLSDEMDAAQQDLPFAGNTTNLRELVLLLNRMRQTAMKKTASEVLDELIAALELAPLPSDADYHYLVRFVEFVKGWQAKNEEKSAQLRRISSLLRRSGRRYLPRRRAAGRCRATDDRTCRERIGIPPRFHFAAQQGRLPGAAPGADVRVSTGADEGRKAEGGFPVGGGAASFLRRADARAPEPDAQHGRQQAQKTFDVPRRHPDERRHSAVGRDAAHAEGRTPGVRGNHWAGTQLRRSERSLWFGKCNGPRLLARGALGQGVSPAPGRAAAIERVSNRAI